MLEQNKHKTVMYRLLTDILRDAYLAAALGFKGGTACYFFYGLPRFSIDLDFNIIAKKDESRMYQVIYDKIKAITEGQKLDIRDGYIKRNTVFFLISYEKGAQNIKIEISRREYSDRYELKDFYGLAVNTMVRADIFAHKLAAATDRKRTASRDFFDIYFFFKESWPINEEIIKIRTGKTLKDYLSFLKKFIEKNISNRNVLQGMGELLDEKQKTWVKDRLKEELTAIISFNIDLMGK